MNNNKKIVGYYLYAEGIDDANISGVKEKIRSQINSFNNFSVCKSSKLISLRNRFSFFKQKDELYFEYSNIAISGVDYLYIRKPGTVDLFFINLLKKIKSYNSSVKIVLEIPTFPYDLEFPQTIIGKISLLFDKYFRKKLYRYIDKIAVLTNDKLIFNIETLKIDNGIDFSKYPVRDFKINYKQYNLCAVAKFYSPHGYERIINGLKDYYLNGGKEQIFIHMVGDGPELSNYVKLVEDLDLNNNFKFYGYVNRNDLIKIYNICDAALGSFGSYKKRIYDTCELKSTESLAFGIPYICGCNCTRFSSRNYKYFLQFPNDPSNISFDRIINFIDNIYSKESIATIIKNIRDFGEKHFNMQTCMKSVSNYILEE